MPSLNTGNAILSNPIKVDSSYNVGIGGAASGSYKLQVTGTGNFTGALTGTTATFSSSVTVNGASATTSNIIFQSASSQYGYIGSGGGWEGNIYTDFAIAASSGKQLNIYTNGTTTPKMIVTTTGNVGIGTSGPNSILEVQRDTNGDTPITFINGSGGSGNTNASISLNFTLRNGSGGSSGGVILKVGKETDHIGANVNDYFAISTTRSDAMGERMRITSGGNVCINTTLVKSRLGTNTKFTVAGATGAGSPSSAGASMGSVAGTGGGSLDTGIDIEATDGGLTLLFLASRNTSGGTNTASAVYIISFYYSGTFPVVTYLGGTSNFVTFGQSGTSLTATNAIGYGNFNCSWFASK